MLVEPAYPVIELALLVYRKWKAGEDVSKLMNAT